MELPIYEIQPNEFANRPNLIIVSDKGLKYRQEFQQHFSLPKIIPHRKVMESPLEDVSQFSKRAQLSLKGINSKQQLIAEFKQELPIDRKYLEDKLEKMTTRLLKQDKPMVHISQRINGLYNQLNQQNRALQKRHVVVTHRVKENPLNSTLEQVSMIEEEELQDRVGAIAAIEQKIYKMHQKYNYSLGKRQETMRHVKQNMSVSRIRHQQENEGWPTPVQSQSVRETFYKERLENRMKEYHKQKYGKQWDKQPPPDYTFKQQQYELEQKQKRQATEQLI